MNKYKLKTSKARFKFLKNGYKFECRIFQTAMLILLIFLVLVASHYDFNLNYFKCTPGSDVLEMCKNPFFKKPTWVNQEYLIPGEYGMTSQGVFNSVYYVPIIIFAFAFIINHLRNNKRFEHERN